MMISATSRGRDTSDAWLAAIDCVVAFIRLAKNSCAAGGIIWSPEEMRYQEGICFQATLPDVSVKLATLSGFCTAAITAASAALTSATKA